MLLQSLKSAEIVFCVCLSPLLFLLLPEDDGGLLDINYDETRWNQPFEIDRYFKWFGDGLNGPANYARICLLPREVVYLFFFLILTRNFFWIFHIKLRMRQ